MWSVFSVNEERHEIFQMFAGESRCMWMQLLCSLLASKGSKSTLKGQWACKCSSCADCFAKHWTLQTCEDSWEEKFWVKAHLLCWAKHFHSYGGAEVWPHKKENRYIGWMSFLTALPWRKGSVCGTTPVALTTTSQPKVFPLVSWM